MLHFPDEFNYLEKTYVMEYDNAHNLLKETKYDANGKIIEWTEYEYDSSGKKIKESNVADFYDIPIHEYEYDDNGNQIKEKAYGKDGTLDAYTVYEYILIPAK
mgnify:CR=1 FL=1